MKTFVPGSILFITSLLLSGNLYGLNPYDKAPLYQHLCEVNKEWLNIKPQGELLNTVGFANEQARIQAHLKRVSQYLRESKREISPTLAAHRIASLDALNIYWKGGSFPLNTFHSYRIPYFIDISGTPCAVGQLIISSGNRDLAEMISRQSNYAYLREMHYPALDAWIRQSGFTADELAWIQPTYPPATSWSADGVKVEGEIEVFLPASEGEKDVLYVGGSFDKVEGVSGMNNIAVFDGTAWSKLGNGFNGRVKALAMFKGILYAGGEFTKADGKPAQHLARWTGSEWEAVGDGFNGAVNALAVHKNVLYVGGAFTAFGSNEFLYIATTYDGSWWEPLQIQANGEVHAFLSQSMGLVVAGEFTKVGNFPAQHIARFTTLAWQILGDGIETAIYALAEHNGKLYAGGSLKNDVQQNTEGFYSWDGISWESENSHYFITGSRISNLLPHENYLYVSGDFSFRPMIGTHGDNIFRYHNANFGEGVAMMKGSLKTATIFNNRLFFGGYVDSLLNNEWITPGGMFYESLPYAIKEPLPTVVALKPYPNPSVANIYFDFPSVSDYDLTLYDLMGRQVRHLTGTGSHVVIKRENLKAGVYIYSLIADGQPATNGRVSIAAPSAH